MSIVRPVSHSTLEVDILAQRENERQAERQDIRGSKFPEAYLPHVEKEPNAPQVVGGSLLELGVNAPQVIDDTLPEPISNYHTRKHGHSALQSNRICGMKKSKFWVSVVVAIIVIIGAAVGGGVGGSQSGSDGGTGSLLSTSRLAAVNFTDENNVDYNCVYYQLTSKEIYLSVWNSTTKVWSVSPVATDVDSILNNTAISADFYWWNEESRRHHVFYYDADNRIRGKAADTPYADTWEDNKGIDNQIYTGNRNALTSYAKECDTCYNTNAVVYVDDELQYASPKGANGWIRGALPDSLPSPANRTSLALKPLYAGVDNGTEYLVLWMTNAGGNLTKLLYNGSNWEGEILQTKIPYDSAIAAFTSGIFVYNDDSASDYTLQVLNTRPSHPSGGVTLSSYSSSSPGQWSSTIGVSAFDGVWNGSGMAANQAGRVYGTTLTSAGNPVLTEWVWNTDDGNYLKVGAVNTTVLS